MTHQNLSRLAKQQAVGNTIYSDIAFHTATMSNTHFLP
jgi:hypothetical protein